MSGLIFAKKLWRALRGPKGRPVKSTTVIRPGGVRSVVHGHNRTRHVKRVLFGRCREILGVTGLLLVSVSGARAATTTPLRPGAPVDITQIGGQYISTSAPAGLPVTCTNCSSGGGAGGATTVTPGTGTWNTGGSSVAVNGSTVAVVGPNGGDIAKETGGNLASIKAKTDNIPALGQALAAGSSPVVLTAAQLAALTPPAAITGYALEGSNVSAATNTVAIATTTTAMKARLDLLATESTLSTLNTKIPASPATDRNTAAGPFACRLSDGSAFYIGLKSGDPVAISQNGADNDVNIVGFSSGSQSSPFYFIPMVSSFSVTGSTIVIMGSNGAAITATGTSLNTNITNTVTTANGAGTADIGTFHPSTTTILASTSGVIGSISLGSTSGKTEVHKTFFKNTAATAATILGSYTVTTGKTLYVYHADITGVLTTISATGSKIGDTTLVTPAGTAISSMTFYNASSSAPQMWTRDYAEPMAIPSGTVFMSSVTPAVATGLNWIFNFDGYEK